MPRSAESILAAYNQQELANSPDHLYIYAIVRSDLNMPSGKLAAQAGHAYADSLYSVTLSDPELAQRYQTRGLGGSKVTLKAKNTNQLLRAYNQALAEDLPCAIVVDSGHVLKPHFDGNPIITAVGIGPVTKEQVSAITKRFNCV